MAKLGQYNYEVQAVDSNNDSIKVITFSGVLNSYDIETYLSIKESIVTLLEQKQIQEDAKK